MIKTQHSYLLRAAILLGWLLKLTASFQCAEDIPLTETYLNGLPKTTDPNKSIKNFIPSVYYGGTSTKYISTDSSRQTIENPIVCVDGASSNTGKIQLYDDGTHGDDYANDGVYTRGCVHYCANEVDYSDVFGFAMGNRIDDAMLTEMHPSVEGTIPYESITAPLIPGAKLYASSHAFFFADVDRKYYPEFPRPAETNSFCSSSARNVPASALLQIFGDAFDFVTMLSLEETKTGFSGGMCKTNYWDRRFGPLRAKIGSISDNCFMSMSGVMTPRLAGIIQNGQIVTGEGVEVQIHEMLHGVTGFEYMPPIDQEFGDGSHVPFLGDYGSLGGPVWDWVKGFPDAVESSDGFEKNGWGVKMFANDDCKACSDDKLSECCTFRYEDYPKTYQKMMRSNKKISPLLLYIAGMIKRNDVEDVDYYCVGNDMGKCGTNIGEECKYTVDDNDRSRITSNYVRRFRINDFLQQYSNGGNRFPEEKYKVVRHAAIHFSSREPTQSEIEFHTLLWRHHEIQKEPWKRTNQMGTYNLGYYDTWYQHTSGHSIMHSRLHGIACGSSSMQVPSCGTNSNVCSGAPCGPGAVCQDLDGQPFCTCRDGLIGDGAECTFPSEVPLYEHLPSAYGLATSPSTQNYKELCFPEDNVWPNYINENSLPPYPGGMAPYAPTSCGSTVCPVGWTCQASRNKCLPPTGTGICENKGFTKGQCKAIGCCQFRNGQCKAKSQSCNGPVDPVVTCSDPNTCCNFSCSQLKLQPGGDDGISQLNNCGKNCVVGISPDINGVKHPEVHLLSDHYYVNENPYNYDNGPLKIQGDNKNMYDRCKTFCFEEKRSDKFLFKVRKNGTVGKRKCGWLEDKSTQKKKKICRKKNLSHQGYKGAADACVDTCAPFVEQSTKHSSFLDKSEE